MCASQGGREPPRRRSDMLDPNKSSHFSIDFRLTLSSSLPNHVVVTRNEVNCVWMAGCQQTGTVDVLMGEGDRGWPQAQKDVHGQAETPRQVGTWFCVLMLLFWLGSRVKVEERNVERGKPESGTK